MKIFIILSLIFFVSTFCVSRRLALMMLVFLGSILLSVFLTPIAILIAVWEIMSLKISFKNKIDLLATYFLDLAKSIDQTGNVSCSYWFNRVLIKPESPYKFGDEDQKISYVLGLNKKYKYFLDLGRKLADFLNCLDPNHVEKAIVNHDGNE